MSVGVMSWEVQCENEKPVVRPLCRNCIPHFNIPNLGTLLPMCGDRRLWTKLRQGGRVVANLASLLGRLSCRIALQRLDITMIHPV